MGEYSRSSFQFGNSRNFSFRESSASLSRSRSRSQSKARSRSRSYSRPSPSTCSGTLKEQCSPSLIRCLSLRGSLQKMATSPINVSEPPPFVVTVRDWIQRELPHIQVPDDLTLADILTGNAVPIFEHLVARVVAPKRAVQLRSSMLLDNEQLWSKESGNAGDINGDNEKKMQQLEKEAEEYEKEIEHLRNRLSKASMKQQRKGRLGVDEPQLREALVDAYIEKIDAGVEICEKYGDVLRSKATPTASSSTSTRIDAENVVIELRRIGDDARAIMGINTIEKVGVDYAKLRVAKLNADIEQLCKRYKLEDISRAIQIIAAEPTAANVESSQLQPGRSHLPEALASDNNNRNHLTDSAQAFAKRISSKLQDNYLRLFADSEALPEDGSQAENNKRLDLLSDEQEEEEEEEDTTLETARRALKELDKTLSELTTGSRARISRCVRETKELDSKHLGPLPDLLERAHHVQKTRGDADIKGLVGAKLKALDLHGVQNIQCDLGVGKMQQKLIENVLATENSNCGTERNNLQRLIARAKREEETREEIEEMASHKLVPLLDKALGAAMHAKERTVPQARAEVDMAAKVDAFIAARVSCVSPEARGRKGAKHSGAGSSSQQINNFL